MDPVIRLNPALDAKALAEAYRATRRMGIPDFLDRPAADRLHQCLVKEVPWGLVVHLGEKAEWIDNERLVAMGREQRAAIAQQVLQAAATKDLAYFYNVYAILNEYLAGKNLDLYVHRALEFVNSEECLSFMREVTGIETLAKADAQATLFGPGHFLKTHDDKYAGGLARVAYVLNLTPTWWADWGGLLQFSEKGRVVETLMPTFNQLNIFTVPQLHGVSYVVPYAQAGRYAVVGWFRDRDG